MGYALIPQIWHNFRAKACGISIQTSGVTFIALAIASFIYLNLGLLFTFILTFLIGIFWFILFVQRVVYKKG
jgi:hypothetical protein